MACIDVVKLHCARGLYLKYTGTASNPVTL